MSPSRRHNRPQKMLKACRKHPRVPAVGGSDLCKNCRHYDAVAKKKLVPAKKAGKG
jgi:hypothetical protein